MPDYTDLPDTAVGIGGIPSGTTVTALRDNPIAIAERATGAPKVQTDFQFVEEIVLAGNATADFVLDNTTYQSYMFVLANVIPSSDELGNSDLLLRTSADGGSTFDAGSDYSYGYTKIVFGGSSSTVTASTTSAAVIADTVGNDGSEDGASGTIFLPNPGLAQKTYFTLSITYTDAVDNDETNNGGGVRLASAAVDAVRFLFSGANLTSGTITMYGLRNS